MLIAVLGSASYVKSDGRWRHQVDGTHRIVPWCVAPLVMVIAFLPEWCDCRECLILSGRKSRQSPIPYGPFLAGAAVLVLLWETGSGYVLAIRGVELNSCR